MKRILNENFIGGEVEIDNKQFIGCLFSNTIITWNGGPYRLEHCTFKDIKIRSKNELIFRAWKFMESMNNLKKMSPH